MRRSIEVPTRGNVKSTGEHNTIPAYVDVWIPEALENIVCSPELMESLKTLKESLLDVSCNPRALLFGGPGLGKTATLHNLAFTSERPFWCIKAERLFSSFLGGSASNIQAAFQSASQASAVLIFDDLDAFARRRDDPRETGEARRVVTALLSVLDNTALNVPVLATTNMPSVLDPAVLRRFDYLLPFEPLDNVRLRALIKMLTGASRVKLKILELAHSTSPAELVDIAKRAPITVTKSDFLEFQLIQRVRAVELIGKKHE